MTYPLKLRFFTVEQGKLTKAAQARVIGLWENKRPWMISDVCDLRLVTVLCDCDLKPLVWHVTRVAVADGWVTEQSRQVAWTAAFHSRPSPLDKGPCQTTPEIEFVLDGWPDDLARQLAIALDSPLLELQSVGIAGPLFTPGCDSVREALALIDASLLRK